MSCIKEADSLKLLSLQSKITHDLEIQFEGSDATISAHKLLLALVSPVLEDQFFGPLSAHARADGIRSGELEVIIEKEFDYETYNMFIRHIYGDKEIIKSCTSYGTLFCLLTMAQLYLLDNMADAVKERIDHLQVTMKSILSVMEIVLVYRNLEGFKEICDKIRVKIVAILTALPTYDLHKFYKLHRQDNPNSVAALIEIMSETKLGPSESKPEYHVFNLSKFYQFYQDHKDEQPDVVNTLVDLMPDFVLEGPDSKPAPICPDCRMPTWQCKNGKRVDVLPHACMQFWDPRGEGLHTVESVNILSSSKGTWMVKTVYSPGESTHDYDYPTAFKNINFTFVCRS